MCEKVYNILLFNSYRRLYWQDVEEDEARKGEADVITRSTDVM